MLVETIIGVTSVLLCITFIVFAIGYFLMPSPKPKVKYFLAGIIMALSYGFSGFVVLTGALGNFGENFTFDLTMGLIVVLFRLVAIAISISGVWEIIQDKRRRNG